MSTTKTKVIDIKTDGAKRAVDDLTSSFVPLRTQIKQLKDQLAQLEQGTVEYDRVAKQLADTQQRQIEITEAAKYSNQDFGQTMSNIAAVSAGVVGAINAVNSVMTMMGADSERAQEAMKNIQLTMAIIQGLSAFDTATKALNGLKVAFTTTAAAAAKDTAAKTADTAATTAMTAANTKGATAVKGLGKAFKAMQASMGVWLLIITAIVTAITALISHYKKAAEEARLAKAEAQKFEAAAADGAVSVIAKYTMLQASFVETKAKGEDLNKWAKQHRDRLDEIGMASMNVTQLEKAFIENSDAFIDALVRRYKAEWRLKAMGDEYAANLKHISNLEDKVAEQATGAVSTRTKISVFVDGEEVTKRYGEWLELANKARNENEKLINSIKEGIKEENNAIAAVNKFGTNFNTTTQTATKSVKELKAEFLALWKEIINAKFDNASFINLFGGWYDQSRNTLLKIRKLIQIGGFGKMLSEDFRNALKNVGELNNLKPFQISIDFLFDEKAYENLNDQLMTEQELLYKYANGQLQVSEAELEKHKRKVDELKAQLDLVTKITDETMNLAKENQKRENAVIDLAKMREDFEKAKEVWLSFRTDVANGNPFADINKSIDELTNGLDRSKGELLALQSEYDKLTNEIANGNNTKYNTERLNELETLILEKEREIFEQESQLEEEHYNERTTYLQQMYDQQMALEEQKLLELQLLQDKYGGGTEDYNAAMKRLEIQRDTFEEQKEITRQYYDELIAQQEENSALAIQLEMEKNAAITALEMEQQKKEIEIEKEKSQRKINIAKSYISAYQNVMGGISDVLGQVMSTMDESSEQYKQLAITQGIINTASGTLGAFMSGVNSGIPAPYNLILAGVMAATTLATGLIGIENIRNEKTQGLTASASNVGSEYETTVYQQQAETLESVGDQRVYVTESDISSTQNRVQVREANATY